MQRERKPDSAAEKLDVSRPRLDALFAAAVQTPLVVVNAGAGFGKSRAAWQYLSRSAYRTVWLGFAKLDNNPARFWEHLSEVFGRHRPALAEKMEQAGFPDTQQAFEAFLADLTGELYQDDLTVVFVFDDLHLIQEPLVLGFLGNLVSAGLENSCMLLMTRRWPVFGPEMTERPWLIETDDLRFTLEETTALLAEANVALGPGEIAEIHEYTAGWPIALSMVALAVRHNSGLGGIPPLASSKHRLFALFEREIFSQYTPAEQSLLIKLSVLESFPRGLVRAVSGEQERDLGALMENNIFIRYDGTARRFYFHPLYLEYLREKLAAAGGAALDETYCKAGDWCRENHHYYDAINYYRQCGSYEMVWETLQLFKAVRRTKAEAEFFIEQIESLPADIHRRFPMTRIVLAMLLLNNLRFDEAVHQLDEVQRELEQAPEPDNALLGEYYVARGLATLGMERTGFGDCFQKAAGLLPQGSRRWGKELLLVDLGPALNLTSTKAEELKKSLAGFVKGVPAMVRVLHGAGQGLDHLCESEAAFLTGEARGALEPAYQALYAAQAASQYDIVGNALFMLLRSYTVLGDYRNIQDTLEHVARYRRDPEAAHLGIWDITQAWFYAEMDESGKVATWIRNPVQHGFPPISIDRALLVRLRCLVAETHYAEALALLGQFEGLAKSKGAVISLLYVEIGRAVVNQALGQYGDALAALEAAYGYAGGNELVMPFIEYGHRTRALLERARDSAGHGIPNAWLADVHAKASTYAKRHAYIAGRYRQEQLGHSADFGLSKREVELLDNLAQGLTREEIGESMKLSLNTVKSMLKQVFAKLGAINSADATRIAVVNGLI